MKALKYILLFLLIIVVIGAIYLATLNGKYDVKRSALVKAEPEVVFNELNDYKTWEVWGPWNEEDPTLVAEYPANTVGEGASYTWTGKEGTGMMRTLKVEKPTRLDQEVVFNTPLGDMKSDVYWILEKVKEGTHVTWGMSGEMGFFTRWMAKSMEDQLGPMEARGLELLDAHIQKKVKVFSIENVGVVEYSGGYYLGTTMSSRIDEIGVKYPIMMLKMKAFIDENKVRSTGSPFTLYHKYDETNGTAIYSVCYPVAEKMVTPLSSNVTSGLMPAGTYFKTILKGGYENSDNAWKGAMEAAAKLTEYQSIENGEPFEIYVNSPATTPNPADLITEIYIPVQPKAITAITTE